MAERWDLTLEEPYVGGISGAVLKAVTRSGQLAVLKVAYPHEEARWEAAGLTSFPDNTAPAVLRQDQWTWSLLLERIMPGTTLLASGLALEDALTVAGELAARLGEGHPQAGIPRLEEAMRDYQRRAYDRLGEQADALDALGVTEAVPQAIADIDELLATGPSGSLLHGDFNPGNILLASASQDATAQWVVVDPKPLVGDPSFDLWPVVSQLGNPYGSPDAAERLSYQATVAAAAAGCDAHRVIRWSRVRTALNVSWYLADNQRELAATEAAALGAWNSVLAG